MIDASRTVNNPGTGETITFLETSEESGGTRVVALITLAPGGAVTANSHRASETFECAEGAFTVHLGDRDMHFSPGEHGRLHQMHGFRNDTDVAATLKVTATPRTTWTGCCAPCAASAGMACSYRASLRGIRWSWRTWPIAAATTPRRSRAGSTGR